MRLINTESLTLEEFMGSGSHVPQYAILSHTWEEDEVTFQDFGGPDREAASRKKGFFKIAKTCELARAGGFNYAWVDTCCIDKSSSAELTEAINSMFHWYRDAVVCYAWLPDLPIEEAVALRSPESCFKDCRWFTRGWTLQELIAPRRVEFYDQEWNFRGTKADLSDLLTQITKISDEVLQNPGRLDRLSVAQRMSWAATRQTSRIEDLAYCLLGIFDVNMPMLYGEGPRAFIRLQEEIAKESNDFSLFAWTAMSTHQVHRGVFADNPGEFLGSGSIQLTSDTVFNPEFIMTNKGLSMTNDLFPGDDAAYLMRLNCAKPINGRMEQLGIWIKQHGGGVYGRVRADELGTLVPDDTAKSKRVFLFKRVSASRSADLERSHSGAFMLRKNFNQKGKTYNSDFGFEATLMHPVEEWDSQRRMFLTHGSSEYAAYGYFTQRTDFAFGDEVLGGESFIIAFGTVEGEGPWLTIGSTRDGADLFQALGDTKMMLGMGRARNKRSVTLMDGQLKESKLVSVSLEETLVDGQMVVCVDIDIEDMQWRGLASDDSDALSRLFD